MSNPEWDKFGSPCAGSRWFHGEPEVTEKPVQTYEQKWPCPVKPCDGEMVFNGMTWPTGNPGVGLYHPKTNTNVGSVLRSVGCFEASLVVIEGERYRKAGTDTTQQYRHVPLIHAPLRESIPFDCVPVAVDLIDGARCLHSYSHPERAFYIFGPEDGTLGKPVTDWCRDVIYVPTTGCLNLAATVNIVLYDRQKKRAREERVLARIERSVA